MEPENECCSNCKYLVDLGDNCHVCRRYPPSLFTVEGKPQCLYPVINHPTTWWCGEHKLKMVPYSKAN